MSQQVPLQGISPDRAKELLSNGSAVLVDVREADEYAREHIPGARLTPLSSFNPSDFRDAKHRVGIFHCASGQRTCSAAAQILSSGFKETYFLEGGLNGWKKAGLAVNVNRKAPISVMRQVQLTAGSLVLGGVILGGSVDPLFYGLSGFVGAGLMFAGASGTCFMAQVLGKMPWNNIQRLQAAEATVK